MVRWYFIAYYPVPFLPATAIFGGRKKSYHLLNASRIFVKLEDNAATMPEKIAF